MNNRLQNSQGCCREAENYKCGESVTYDPLQTLPLAMAYIPWQQWQNVYEGAKGLQNGTIFEELVFPFECASRVCANGNECRTNDRYSRTRYDQRERMSRRERTGHYERRCE